MNSDKCRHYKKKKMYVDEIGRKKQQIFLFSSNCTRQTSPQKINWLFITHTSGNARTDKEYSKD